MPSYCRFAGQRDRGAGAQVLADSRARDAVLGDGGTGLVERVRLVRDDDGHRALAAVVYVAAAAVVVLPTVFVALPWLVTLPVPL
jgi:hypothetical protein